MKKLFLFIVAASMLLLFIPTQLKAETASSTAPIAATAESAASTALLARLDEIKAMDISVLNSSEKKELRKEVREIKSELKVSGESNSSNVHGGGIYLSAGAAIIIVLLLIILI